MKIGLISDSHDMLPLIEKAVQKLNGEKVELVLHAGDYSAPFAALRFKPLKAPMVGVFGNNDAEKEVLRKNFESIGKQVRSRFTEVKADRLKIALLHGEETDLLSSIIGTSCYDVVVHGHTHQASVHKQNGTLVVNPGEICGYLTGRATIALLDADSAEAEIVPL